MKISLFVSCLVCLFVLCSARPGRLRWAEQQDETADKQDMCEKVSIISHTIIIINYLFMFLLFMATQAFNAMSGEA